MISVRYLGQCGFQIFTDTVNIVIDPVLNDLVENGKSIRCYPPVLNPKELETDYVFCTHEHIDHMAIPTLLAIAENCSGARFVVPDGCVSFLSSQGIDEDRIIAVSSEVKQEIVTESGEKIEVTGIMAAHPVQCKDENGKDRNLAYRIVLEDTSIVHLGDTYYTEQLESAIVAAGKTDLLFAPINGREAEKGGSGIIGNMSAKEAAALASVIGAQLSVPTHFDMVIGNTVNPCEFADCMEELCPDGQYWIPKFEELLELQESDNN